MPMVQWTSTSDPRPRRARRTTGSRRFPARAGVQSSGSMARLSRDTTKPGGPERLNSSSESKLPQRSRVNPGSICHPVGLDQRGFCLTLTTPVTLSSFSFRFLELTAVGQSAVEDQGVEGAEMAAVCAHLCELRPGFLNARNYGPTDLRRQEKNLKKTRDREFRR